MPKTTDERLNELKQKYDSVLRLMEDGGMNLHNLQLLEDKLYLRATAPSEAIKARIQHAVEAVDPTHADIELELVAQENGPRDQSGGAGAQNYVTGPGDSLADVSRRFYGSPGGGSRILAANPGKIPDPDRLEPGQTLVIPG